MQMKDEVKLKMSLPCHQGLNGHKPPASIQHIRPAYSQGTSPAEPISTPVITPGPCVDHEKYMEGGRKTYSRAL